MACCCRETRISGPVQRIKSKGKVLSKKDGKIMVLKSGHPPFGMEKKICHILVTDEIAIPFSLHIGNFNGESLVFYYSFQREVL